MNEPRNTNHTKADEHGRCLGKGKLIEVTPQPGARTAFSASPERRDSVWTARGLPLLLWTGCGNSIPEGLNVNSRGCNPRKRYPASPSALQGPNGWFPTRFDPCRVENLSLVRPPGFTRSYSRFTPFGVGRGITVAALCPFRVVRVFRGSSPSPEFLFPARVRFSAKGRSTPPKPRCAGRPVGA